jgi:hypothetical protein
MLRRLLSVGTVMFVGVAMVACDRAPTATSLDGTDLQANTSDVENGYASGGVSVVWDAADRSRGDIDLSVHEGGAESSDRGTFEWEAYDQNGDLVREMTITATDVEISGSTARFIAQVTHDSWGTLLGDWYAFYAEDLGSPGPDNDDIQWTNASTRAGLPGGGNLSFTKSDLGDRFTIVDGNLTIG